MKLGYWGEAIACGYLEKQGYEILEKNFRCRMGELDIIAKKEETICFVEVKTRGGLQYGFPAEAVTATKREHIFRVIQFYLLSHHWIDMELRIDVIEILHQNHETYIRHIENAF